VTVDCFWMDEHTVTSAEFAAFVKATGYGTLAERPPGSRAVSRRPTGVAYSRLRSFFDAHRAGQHAGRPQPLGLCGRARSGAIPKAPGSEIEGRE
jgi:formylglycine-generating enzyme required for sulfatase activity